MIRIAIQLTAIALWGSFLQTMLLGAEPSGGSHTPEGPALILKTNAVVTSAGIFIADLVQYEDNRELPHIRVSHPPAFGTSLQVSREQVQLALEKAAPHLESAHWKGSTMVHITRRARRLAEDEMLQCLTEALEREFTSLDGQLEIRLTRPWGQVVIPDEPFELKFTGLPVQGIMPGFLVRFELGNEHERFGTWQVGLRASLWKDCWVARQRLKRGESLKPSDVASEKRDVLQARDLLMDSEIDFSEWELMENIAMGEPLHRWSVRPKPSVYRGQVVDAAIQQGQLTISLKVEVQEDGVNGDVIRVRNPQTKRELFGKVINEQTIHIQM